MVLLLKSVCVWLCCLDCIGPYLEFDLLPPSLSSVFPPYPAPFLPILPHFWVCAASGDMDPRTNRRFIHASRAIPARCERDAVPAWLFVSPRQRKRQPISPVSQIFLNSSFFSTNRLTSTPFSRLRVILFWTANAVHLRLTKFIFRRLSLSSVVVCLSASPAILKLCRWPSILKLVVDKNWLVR
jgi:hypothetical protein